MWKYDLKDYLKKMITGNGNQILIPENNNSDLLSHGILQNRLSTANGDHLGYLCLCPVFELFVEQKKICFQ